MRSRLKALWELGISWDMNVALSYMYVFGCLCGPTTNTSTGSSALTCFSAAATIASVAAATAAAEKQEPIASTTPHNSSGKRSRKR